VARRTGEIGIRTALGDAGAGDRYDRGRRAAPAVLAAGRVLADQLYGVKSWDPMILAGAAAILTAAAAITGFAPALRVATENSHSLRMLG
jgi:hypothetical protein